MKEARRLFSKSHKLSPENASSSVFKSKIARKLPNDSSGSCVGPGQYNIALPIVKPKFEAIRKNNNTLIIKVNEKLSPVFQSIEPRFKDAKTSREEEPSNEVYALLSRNNSQDSLQKEDKMSIGMKNRLKRLAEIINIDQIKQRQRKVNSLHSHNASQFDTIEGNAEIINSLKLYKKERERLHFILKNIKNKQHSKGISWSKYRETKGNLYSINNVPGPGAYNNPNQSLHSTNRYAQAQEEKSWQFKSLTKRNSFGRLPEQRLYEVAPSPNRFVSDINGRFCKVDSIPLIKHHSTQDELPLPEESDID